ncbi:MAG TPA: mechanosensitive ion channel domain-containing protein [Longimicrobiales bacterium]|nr:mechanosensitive ion channel domain-containing protein [Longimicrobiales bacterium]
MDLATVLEQVRAILDFVVFGAEWDNPVTVKDLMVATIIMFLASLFSRLVRRGLRPLATKVKPMVGETAVKVTMRIIHWGILFVGVVVALNTVGISVSSLSGLFTAGAVVTVAVGFAMQNIAQNFVSGALLAAERSIKAGDVIEVEGSVLRVQNLGIRTTVASTRDDETIIIPNSLLVQNPVKNFTYQDSIYRIRSRVGVSYGSDMRQVFDVLFDTAEHLEWRSRAMKPRVFMSEFGDSAVVFEVSVWVNDPWRAPQHRSDLSEAIWFALKDAGITIAFPQMDLHLDRSVVEAMGAHRPGRDQDPEPASAADESRPPPAPEG